MAKKLKITQIKSSIRRLGNQKLTLEALGIRKMGQSSVHEATPAIVGMIKTVAHLVKTEEVK